MPYTDDDRWNDWVERIHSAYADVVNLHHVRYVWKNLIKMLEEVEGVEHHSLINNWLTYTYSTSLAVGIRRQSDQGKLSDRPLTLSCVLSEMVKYPTVVTAERYLASIDETNQARCRAWYESAVAIDAIGPNQAAHDLHALGAASEGVRKYVNKHLAHKDSKVDQDSLSMSFADLDRALDELARVLRDYYQLLTGKYILHFTPMAGLGWPQMFATPWLPSGFTPLDEQSLG